MANDPDDVAWLDRIEPLENEPRDLAAALTEIRELLKIRAHREWRIDELTRHVANIEAALATSQARVAALEEHVGHVEKLSSESVRHASNVEHSRDEALADARNLAKLLAEREARLTEVEAHLLNLESRIPPRPTRLAEGRMFPTSPDARTEALFRAAERLRDSRPDLRKRFAEDRAADFWYWLLWNGARDDADVRDALPPVPDSHLIGRVVGEQTDSDTYLRGGLVDWWSIEGSLRRAGFDPTKGGRVLDFGCGCGRVLNLFALYADRCELHGADVDAEAVAWCQAHLPVARFAALAQAPPTAYADGFFDAIYAYSVFSHLPEPRHFAWLAELARISKPGAALVLTTQGDAVAQKLVSGERPAEFPKARALEKRMPELATQGFLFFPYERLRFHDTRNDAHFAEWDLAEYGATFILESYIRERWSKWFDVVEVVPSPDDWQDHVILRRR